MLSRAAHLSAIKPATRLFCNNDHNIQYLLHCIRVSPLCDYYRHYFACNDPRLYSINIYDNNKASEKKTR